MITECTNNLRGGDAAELDMRRSLNCKKDYTGGVLNHEKDVVNPWGDEAHPMWLPWEGTPDTAPSFRQMSPQVPLAILHCIPLL